MPHSFAFRSCLIPAAVLALGAPAALAVHAGAALAADEAGEDAAPGDQSDEGPAAGTLMLRGQGIAQALPAVRLGTDMEVNVTGQVARVRVTQAFRNTSDKWMEASYLYPLSQDGAVDSLKMVVGQRVIVGRIQPREKARAAYEQAKASGRKAGLVEQQRPNMFSTMVANVGPGETVLIAIEYQAPVAQANGTFSLRLPLVVGPRYTPPHTLNSDAAVADANAVTAAPVLDPKVGAKLSGGLNPTSIAVRLAPGFDVANLISRYHRVNVSGPLDDRTVRLADTAVPADRDFVLEWRSASADPTLGLFAQHTAKGDYLMASVTPPADLSALPTPPREMVFVIDNSGSMGGDSMDEAKASLIHALGTLRPQDHFNVIRFDDTMTRLFEHSVAATPDQVALARRFAGSLEAQGGTEMLPALRAALTDAGSGGGSDPEVLRQIVFMTDGEISNEREMMAAIGADGGRSHVFMVGIGSAPNDYLMERMSTIGGGVYTHVGAPGEVAAKMMPLLDVLSHPAVRDLSVRVEGGSLDLTPSRLPDVYAGRPLVLVGRSDHLAGTLTVSGRIGGKLWERRVDLAAALPSPAVEKLWARRRITDIEADRALGKLDDTAADAEVERVGMENGIVTSRTSLVAVDETRSRPDGAPLTREELPINLPAGWDFGHLFGQAAQRTAVGDGSGDLAAMQAQALELPQTATGFLGVIGKGCALLLAGLAGFAVLMRRRAA
ncbi:marine proteobacterial sortase target protein [Novosphingobium sp. P6W]|uniref:marine proteobacterial sortase target protein n=1 Tax=Novosphingobium sp. P6W TaxID=1609758 RepID=UPI0005C31160|nr:marine proteobacterial sortase target protein [Novosphingobium sp. P6W]AXB79168.1 marine proteobacterial sortase target protein [Novosphingobium sp. P6W]KIS31930.1 cell wall anchor domain-containing protein [Novosphingobium sp. P6W]